MRTRIFALALVSVALGSSSATFAGSIPYDGVGPNTQTYSFTATGGDVSLYFAGQGSAGFDQSVGILINGVQSGGLGLDNQTSAIGAQLDFGAVAKNSVVTFIDVVNDSWNNTQYTWSSNLSSNVDGINHVYSTTFAGGSIEGSAFSFPAGAYVGFEDQPNGGDFNYHDSTFVATGVATAPGPVAGAGAPALLAIAGLGFALRRRRARAC